MKAQKPKKSLTEAQKKVERIKVKNKAKGDPKVPKEHRVAFKIVIEEHE